VERIALFFDKPYIQTQHCYMDIAIQLAKSFDVDLYMILSSNNNIPFFEEQNIRILPFPRSQAQKMEFWARLFSGGKKYKAVIGTPLEGAWLSYQVSKIQGIPFYYFADELFKNLTAHKTQQQKKVLVKRMKNIQRNAAATIIPSIIYTGPDMSLDERLNIDPYYLAVKSEREEFLETKQDTGHSFIVLPNAPSYTAKKQRSHFYRDIFNIDDDKPILFYAGTLDWALSRKIFEETKSYQDKPYHLIFQARTLGLMGDTPHPFIKISTVPIPSSMMNYAVSSVDIGLALYDKNRPKEAENGFSSGKIGTYLKNEIPMIAGSLPEFKAFETHGVATFWDGEEAFDNIALRSISELEANRRKVPAFYEKYLQYEVFFEKLYTNIITATRTH